MKDTSKYYYNSKSKKWFPFKKRKFNTSKHAIFTSKAKCTYKAECLLSYQENQMLEGLSNSLQSNFRDTLRISIHHLHKAGCMIDKSFQEKAKATSKEKGHTSRSKKLSVRITKDEFLKLDDIAEINYLSIKEAIRVTLIWMSKGLREDLIKNIKNCTERKPDEIANEWKEKQTEFKQSGNVKELREIREFWKQHYIDEKEEKRLKRKEDKFYNRMIKQNIISEDTSHQEEIDERFKDILEKQGLEEETLSFRDQRIYSMMAMYQVDYQSACLFYEDEIDEQNRISNMSASEFMQHMKAEKNAKHDREWNEIRRKQQERRDKLKKLAISQYKDFCKEGEYPPCFIWNTYDENPLSSNEIEIILETGIKTKEELEADLKEHRAKLKVLQEEERIYFAAQDLNNEKRILHLFKTEECNPNFSTYQQKNWTKERWELFNTYDEWIEAYLADPYSHLKLLKQTPMTRNRDDINSNPRS